MPATIHEKPRSRRHSGASSVRVYLVEDATDDEAARTLAISTAPASVGSNLRVDRDVEAVELDSLTGRYEITVPYRSPSLPEVGGGAVRTRLRISLSPQSVTATEAPVKSVTPDDNGLDASSYSGQIGVANDGSVSGTEIETCRMLIEASFTLADGAVNTAYLNTLINLTTPTHVNESALTMNIGSSDFPNTITFPAKSLRFRGMDVAQSDSGQWDCTASFEAAGQVSKPFKYASIGEGTVTTGTDTVTADGHDVIWFAPVPDTTDGKATVKIRAAYVHSPYPAGDLSALNIPAT